MNVSAEKDDMENPIQSSKEPKIPIQESTKQDDQKLNFRFQVNPAIKLKQALEALTDADFNPNGLGFIEVEEKGLAITVRNPKIEVVGHLWLKSSGLINFEFNNAMINKMISLNCILENLVDASADDTVTLSHFHGSSQLNFMFGNADSPREFAVDLMEITDGSLEKFSNISYACEAVILSDDFREIIQAYQAVEEDPNIVSVSITAEIMTVHPAGDLTWRMYDKVNGIRGMEPNTMHCAWFKMHHHRSLNKASFIAKGLLLCLVTDPPKPEQIMLRFNLRELGDLVFVSKAGFISFNTTFDDYCNGLLRLAALLFPPKLR